MANNLYRGVLPDQFQDLTWVEEMVCSLYRNTAHITHLYGLSDPSQPTILHGNICAHEMNVISTASILPHTPTDVNGMLSVVFVGAGKLNAQSLHNMFRVRKKNFEEFLIWLKNHNHLYMDIPIDQHILDMYPEDAFLPGIQEHVVEENEIHSEYVFSEETAGFSDHHAQEFHSESLLDINVNNSMCNKRSKIEINQDEVLSEKTGVIDPECDRLSGWSFTASALKNLACNLHCEDENIQGKNKPDLAIHHAATAVSEYNNPDLMLGMFPTLYPFGIGGFEDKSHKTPISFKEQAAYYFNISDRSFCYHFSYMFVALNMLQCRLAHLHTSFTVKNSNFEAVA